MMKEHFQMSFFCIFAKLKFTQRIVSQDRICHEEGQLALVTYAPQHLRKTQYDINDYFYNSKKPTFNIRCEGIWVRDENENLIASNCVLEQKNGWTQQQYYYCSNLTIPSMDQDHMSSLSNIA